MNSLDGPSSVDTEDAVFWDVTLCSLVEIDQCFGGAYCLHCHNRRAGGSSKQVKGSSKQIELTFVLLPACLLALIHFCLPTQLYFPEDNTLHSQHCKNLRSQRGDVCFPLRVLPED
jgi:hypothetical protein